MEIMKNREWVEGLPRDLELKEYENPALKSCGEKV